MFKFTNELGCLYFYINSPALCPSFLFQLRKIHTRQMQTANRINRTKYNFAAGDWRSAGCWFPNFYVETSLLPVSLLSASKHFIIRATMLLIDMNKGKYSYSKNEKTNFV